MASQEEEPEDQGAPRSAETVTPRVRRKAVCQPPPPTFVCSLANCFSSRLACLYTRFLYRNCAETETGEEGRVNTSQGVPRKQPRLSGCAGGWGPRQQTPPVSGEPTASLPQTPHVTGITPAKVRGHVAGKTQEHPGAWGHPSLSRRSHGRCASRGWRSSSSRPRAWSRQQTRMCLPHPALGSPGWQSRCPCCHPGTLGDICSLKSSTSSELDMNYFTLTRSVPKRNVWVSVCLEAQHPYLVPGPRARTPLRADVGEPRLKSGEGQPLARARIPRGGTCSEPSPTPIPPAVAGHLPRLGLAS